MLEIIRDVAGKIKSWVFGARDEYRADFAAVTEEYADLAKNLRDNMLDAQNRLLNLEDRMEKNRERYIKILDELTDVKLKMTDLILTEKNCQAKLTTTQEMLATALSQLDEIKNKMN